MLEGSYVQLERQVLLSSQRQYTLASGSRYSCILVIFEPLYSYIILDTVTISYTLIVNKRVRSPTHIDRIPQDTALIASDPNSVNVNGKRMTPGVNKIRRHRLLTCRVSV